MPLNLDSLAPPISLRPSVTLSDEELMRFSADNKGYKIERNNRGEITIMSPVGGIGSVHEGYVYGEFYLWSRQDGTGKCFSPSGGFNLPDGSCLSPDVAWMTLDRWESLTVEQQTGFPPLCPDFLVEVRSESDPRKMIEAKMQLWLDNGAQLAWLVDPIDANVTIYRPGHAHETLDHPRVAAATAPVEGFVLECSVLWAVRA
jgi:Uma2 family endonuclease